MIPHIIHYCWFGPKSFSDLEIQCIESWKKYLPNYELKLWNEKTIDLHQSKFAEEAYLKKKYAFVSDYVRAKVLYEYGGLYFDTDFELLKPIDDLIEFSNFLGFETQTHLGTAIMAFEAHHYVMKQFLAYYEKHSFLDSKGRMDNTANVTVLTDLLIPLGLKTNRERQHIKDIEIYPRDYFYPKRLKKNVFSLTVNTVGVHRCQNSWMTEKQIKRGNSILWTKILRPILYRCRIIGVKLIGKEKIRQIEIVLRNKLG